MTHKKIIYPKFIEKENLVLEVNEEYALHIEIVNHDEQCDLQLFSTDNDIVQIIDKHTIYAKSEGYVEIHAMVYGKSSFINVRVIQPIKKGSLQFVGHRGVAFLAPENTLESFELAIQNHFDFVETDIRITKDKQMILYHDKSLKRLFDQDKLIKDCTLEELQSLKFVNGYNINKYPNARIPTFEDYLKLVSQYCDIRPIIELKDESLHDENIEFLVQINNMIYQYHLENRARVISAIKENIELFRKINHTIDMGYISEDENFDDIDYLKQNQFMLCWKYSKCNKSFLKILSKENISVDLWLINDKGTCYDLLDWPITSVTSNLVLFHE